MRLELEQNKATLAKVQQALTIKTEAAAAMDNTGSTQTKQLKA